MEDIRWKKRLNQLKKAASLMIEGLKISSPSRIEQAGLIKAFDLSLELSGKLLKDFLVSEGFDVATPRAAIKQAYQNEIIQDGELWLVALSDRNLTTQIHEGSTADLVVGSIKSKYAVMINELIAYFDKYDSE
jgi:nucleotidyltransferase substrate binding protein (TIGR01987 family)